MDKDFIKAFQSATYSSNPADVATALAMLGSLVVFLVISLVVLYFVLALSFVKIAKKTNTKHAWLAWVPILQLILMFNIAGMSGWWTFSLILSVVPVVGPIAVTIFMVYVWTRICKACGKPDFLGIFIIIPLGQIILPLYLAFAE